MVRPSGGALAGRFCLERPFATFYDLQRALSAFDRLEVEPDQSEQVSTGPR